VSEPILARYDFLSHVRRGAAADLTNVDPLSGPLPSRGPLAVTVTVRSSGSGDTRIDDATTNVAVRGPGDVVGVDPRHVIRTEPRAGTLNYEPNYFAGIEFDHPEFPWLFTPASASGDRLRPWLALLALAEGEFTVVAGRPHPLRAIEVSPTLLPRLADSWAWAHAQVTGGLGGASVEHLQATEPGRVLSRLLCLRRLKPMTRYTAFLVPAFDLGVKAGLGEDVPSGPGVQAQPAWAGGVAGAAVRLPVYYSFDFQTSARGDFESLVRALAPRVLPKEVGIRLMDVDRPGWGMPSAGPPLGLGGALRSVLTTETPWTGTDRAAFEGALAPELNRTTPLDDPAHDPVVVPPLYGRWHAARTTLELTLAGWFDGLNRDPRPRSMAGFGTRVVLDQLPQLMHSAWRQVDGIARANQLLRQARLAKAASVRILEKHFLGADAATVLSLTAPLHARVLASPRTVRAELRPTALPVAALSATFRKVTSMRGAVRGRQDRARAKTGTLLARLATGRLRPLPLYRPPGHMLGLGQSASDKPAPLALEAFAQRLPAWLRRLLLRLGVLGILFVPVVVAVAVTLVGLLSGQWVAGLVLGVVVGLALAVVLELLRRTLAAGVSGEPAPGEPPPDHPADGSAADAIGGGLAEVDLRPSAFRDAPVRPDFRVVDAGQPQPAGNWPIAGRPAAGAADSSDAAAFRAAGEKLAGYLEAVHARPAELSRPHAPIDRLASTLLERIDPALTIPARLERQIRFTPGLATVVWDPEALDEIMAAPEFPQPMYEPLRDISQELLLPGLELIPQNTLGLLNENHAFIEAYLVGLNHEMARELLWNDYPTDQRGSYFRQFWDVSCYVPGPGDPIKPDQLREKLKDVPPVHRWPALDPLGQHRNRPHTSGDNLVLLVRGELLRRYPNTVVYACEAIWNPTTEKHDIPDPEHHKNPEFRGTLDPDITFFGFDLTAAEALGDPRDRTKPQGWFFVFQEQPSEPRFGLEPEPDPFAQPTVHEWNDLSWANFANSASGLAALEYAPAMGPLYGTIAPATNPDGENPGDVDNAWARDAAQTAFITMRRPVRIAVHAETMLPRSS
jgi:hypothetical protein